MVHGGYSWFEDLTVPDPYCALPVLCALSALALVAKGITDSGGVQDTTAALK
jgi:hypothetical protein